MAKKIKQLFPIKRFKSTMKRRHDDERYELFGHHGGVLGLPMREQEVREARDWCEKGYYLGVAARTKEMEALRSALELLTDWAEAHREQAKRAGAKPAIDAARVAKARKLLAKGKP